MKIKQLYRRKVNSRTVDKHKLRVFQELQDLGLPHYELHRKEIKYLPRIIHEDEHLGGIVYGRYKGGFAIMVATDRRVIFLDKKPLFTINEEMAYRVVSGVSFGTIGLDSTVTLHTKIKDYKLRTFSEESANKFVTYIESRCLENNGGIYNDNFATIRSV